MPNSQMTIEELDHYCGMARALDCPVCGSSDRPLNGAMTHEVMSFVVFTRYTKKIKVACPDCLDKASTNALVKSAALGWWGIPWGIIRTVQAIGQNLKSKKTNHSEGPNNYLRGYVLNRVGQFETHKDNRERLQEIISAS